MKPDINEMILFEDRDIIVCRKPAGVPVQSSCIGVPDMVSLLKNHLAAPRPRSGGIPKKAGAPYLAVIHRLDQPVAGLLVFAKTPAAAKDLNRQLTTSGFGKYYMALVRGVPDPAEGTLENYMVKDGRTNTSRICPKDTPGAKKAVLHYRVEGTRGGLSLVRIHLDTGRHHQIRVQMAGMGCPIVGDRKYGLAQTEGGSESGGTDNVPGKENTAGKNVGNSPEFLRLFAYRLKFAHPGDHREMEFVEPFPYFD